MKLVEVDASNEGHNVGKTETIDDEVDLNEEEQNNEDSIIEADPSIGHQNDFIVKGKK